MSQVGVSTKGGRILGNVSETPTPTTCHLQFVRQYAPHFYRRTFLASKLRRKGNPAAVRLPFVRQYFWKNTGGWGHRNVSEICQEMCHVPVDACFQWPSREGTSLVAVKWSIPAQEVPILAPKPHLGLEKQLATGHKANDTMRSNGVIPPARLKLQAASRAAIATGTLPPSK